MTFLRVAEVSQKGFIDAGYDILVGVDNDEAALSTFKRNHNGAVTLNADLSATETFTVIDGIVGKRKIDVIIAGPPCQGFSLTGPRNFDDKRNKLYLAVFEAVKKYEPRAFIIVKQVDKRLKMWYNLNNYEIFNRFAAPCVGRTCGGV